MNNHWWARDAVRATPLPRRLRPVRRTDDGLAALPRWSISAEPTTILADDGTPAQQFTRVTRRA